MTAPTPAEQAVIQRFEAAPAAFRDTTVDQLDRSQFGLCVSIPDRAAVGYLYAVRDNFNDGYPSRLIVLVHGNGEAFEEEFTDSDPAGYPKTMRTRCLLEVDEARTETDDSRHDGIVREATDLCWKATPFTEDETGAVAAYLLPAGVVHRLIGQLQGAGYPAAFRVPA